MLARLPLPSSLDARDPQPAIATGYESARPHEGPCRYAADAVRLSALSPLLEGVIGSCKLVPHDMNFRSSGYGQDSAHNPPCRP